MNNQIKYIHLLYVPTMACNMGCKYCYLEDNTKDEKTNHTALETLEYAVNKFKKENVVVLCVVDCFCFITGTNFSSGELLCEQS